MSAISISTLSAEKYAQKAEDFLMCSFEKYIYHAYLKVGEGIKEFDEVKHNLAIKKLICGANCEVSNYIKEQLTKKEVCLDFCPLPTKL